MKKRKFGNTSLMVSEVGFGAWAIGGPAMAGDIPIGWGKTDDKVSVSALKKAADLGINFFDTADFYGLGHSEELIGNTFGNDPSVIIATKVGHRLSEKQQIYTDYSGEYIIKACENSLKRLKREQIDYYQLHTAKVADLKSGDWLEALEKLKQQGKIRYWGVSLNTYNPFPEAEFLIKNKFGSGLQLVFNILNQRARDLLTAASGANQGVIARMPLQFGLLANKFKPDAKFEKNDHRKFRLKGSFLERIIPELEPAWDLAAKYNVTPAALSLSFVLSFSEISTVIPGIKNPLQAIENAESIIKFSHEDKETLMALYDNKLTYLLDDLEKEEAG